MLTLVQLAQQRRRRPPPSLKQQYQQYIMQRIEGYKNSIPREELLSRLDRRMAEAAAVIDRLGEADLLRKRVVQGFDYDGVGILVHVVEHFSYHTGQIAYFVKARKGIDLGFYRGVDLSRKNKA